MKQRKNIGKKIKNKYQRERKNIEKKIKTEKKK